MKRYDLAVIGAGPGGYIAALYAARQKKSVCVIERDHPGGTCLNRGCIPTKTFLQAASILSAIRTAPLYGVAVDSKGVDLSRLVARKNEIVSRLRSGIETLFRAAKIDLIRGQATIKADGSVDCGQGDTVGADSTIIAVGSSVQPLDGFECDGRLIHSSDTILDSEAVPSSLIIIGAGAVGCEFASFFNALGANVTIIELADRLIPAQSREASRKLEQSFTRRGITCMTGSRVESCDRSSGVSVKLADGRAIAAECVLVAIGRRPNTTRLGLEDAQIKTDGRRIIVDEDLRTSRAGFYAIGDCVIGPQLAHKASHDGLVAVDTICGRHRKADYSTIPNCIWTDPPVASVGLTEDDARARLPAVRVAKFPYIASGKAYLSAATEGFVKIVGDHAGKLVGVEIMGEGACELIAEAVLAKTAGITIPEWARVPHAHPTLSEMIQEATQIFCGTGIHTI